MKLPAPVPSEVLLFVIVGFVVVAQQTPLAVIEAPPSLVILPPLVADVEVIADAVVVVITGKVAVAFSSLIQRTETPNFLLLEDKILLFLS